MLLSVRSSVVMKLIDVTDFQASVFPDLTEIIGGSNPVILIANKFDLLPKGASLMRVRLVSDCLLEQPSNLHSGNG